MNWATSPHQQQPQQEQSLQHQQQVRHQQLQQQQRQQQPQQPQQTQQRQQPHLLHLQQHNINQISPTNTSQNDRTYTELQTVRGGSRVTDAKQVLRQHHQQESTTSTNLTILQQSPGKKVIGSRLAVSANALSPRTQTQRVR